MKVINIKSDFNSTVSGTDKEAFIMTVDLEDGTQKYLRLIKPFTKKDLAAALHYFGNKEFNDA